MGFLNSKPKEHYGHPGVGHVGKRGFASNDPKYDQGNLSNKFNWSSIVVPLAVSTVTFFVLGYIDNALFDPFMFDPIHASQNPNVTAYKAWSMDNFGWMHDAWGIGEEGVGLLSMWPFSEWLAPYMPDSAVSMATQVSQDSVANGFSGSAAESAVSIGSEILSEQVVTTSGGDDFDLDAFMNE